MAKVEAVWVMVEAAGVEEAEAREILVAVAVVVETVAVKSGEEQRAEEAKEVVDTAVAMEEAGYCLMELQEEQGLRKILLSKQRKKNKCTKLLQK